MQSNPSPAITSFLLTLFTILLTVGFESHAADNEFVQYDQPALAFKNVLLIDGTGKPAKSDQTVVVVDGVITQVGQADSVDIPSSAQVIDGQGKTLIPGLIMMHEHMFYPTGKRNYTEMLYSFPRLYLAGGATTIRTAGTTAPYADLNLRDAITNGDSIGPDIDVTAPYLNGPGLPILKIKALQDAQNAKRMMQYWNAEGVTSYKAYMHIRQDEMKEVLKQAHAQNHKVTGHLCSVTYREAAELGIDNLEHGFFASSDFVKNKEKDKCPAGKDTHQSLHDLDLDSKEVKDLIAFLVEKDVALTSTLTVFETFTTGRPKVRETALEALIPQVRDQYESRWEAISKQENATWPVVFEKMRELEKRFVEAGGRLMVGTDPTGYGGVIAGFSNQRAIELLFEAGFSIEQTIKIASLNAAQYLDRDEQIGSIEPGKRADLVLIEGDLSTNIESIRNMQTVFKQGIGYDSQKLIEKTKSVVGLH
ncbi:MAG: Xaa-Pro dipeptidase [Aliiglaciecola sp.]